MRKSKKLLTIKSYQKCPKTRKNHTFQRGLCGGRYKTRTCDLPHVKRMRYQLRQSSGCFSLAKCILHYHPANVNTFFAEHLMKTGQDHSCPVLSFQLALTRTMHTASTPKQLALRFVVPAPTALTSQPPSVTVTVAMDSSSTVHTMSSVEAAVRG